MTSYKVRAAYVTAHSTEAAELMRALSPTRHRQDLAISGYNRGQVLPSSVPADEIERMLAANLIEEIEL